MHEMQTIVTDVRGVCLSVCPSGSSTACVCCIRAAFAKLLWPLVGFPTVDNPTMYPKL